ncbi:AraC family transcriptional regulator [Alteromonas sp. a30]|uniref:AraC family transcriptional regulator n=1 Tax=Alteromonas sp. a30 TaxID=2730917 RepID=UPI00227FDC54|nr:AraC family transcriptional regulator [Alteromonas sp. a30]MCY7297285.1 AraC family transcriptional regulator [Alteromonas sp. a30]
MSDRPSVYLDNPDALSSVMKQLGLSANVYVSGEFCGAWAVDSSGSRKMPFHLISKGEAWLHLPEKEPVKMNEGSLVLFPHDNKHIIASSVDAPDPDLINAEFDTPDGTGTHMICGFFEFKNKTAWPLLDSFPDWLILDMSSIGKATYLKNIIELLIAELDTNEPGMYAAIENLAHLLFTQIIRQQIRADQLQSGLLFALFDSKISRALSAIHNNPESSWSLDSLAATCALSRSAFAQKFQDLVGMSAMKYLTHWRMQQATLLLESSQLSIAEIAERCGYESEPAFRKAFRNTTGNTPGSVRRVI